MRTLRFDKLRPAIWTRSAATQPRRGDFGLKAEIINPSLTATLKTPGLKDRGFLMCGHAGLDENPLLRQLCAESWAP